MEIIAPVVAVFAIFLAIIFRLVEESRKEDKRARIAKRTNTKVWNRADQAWTRQK